MSTPDSSQLYYLRLNGEKVGPYYEEQIREMLSAGQLAPSELAWKEGMEEWQPCSTVFGAVNVAEPQPAEEAGSAAPEPPPLPQEVQYRVTRDGNELGSFTESAIREMLKSGELPPHALVWKEGMDAWQPCSAVFKSSAQDIALQVVQSAEVLGDKMGKVFNSYKSKLQNAQGDKNLVKKCAIGAAAFLVLVVLGFWVLSPSDIDFEYELKRVQKAAEAGDPVAQNEIASRANVGLGIPIDKKMMFQLAREAALQGNAVAQWNLGLIYKSGDYVPESQDKSSAWFKKSFKHYQKKAEDGDAEAQYALGVFYCIGGGVTQNIATGEKWIRKAAEQGHEIAQIRLSKFLGDRGSAKLREYGKQGNLIANVLSLADIIQGNGDELLSDKALDAELQKALSDLRRYPSYARLICRMDDISIFGELLGAMLTIGKAYEKGELLPKNETETAKWYQLAAEIGYPPAMCEFGKCYIEGKGVSENTKKGLVWVRKAAELGSYEAKRLFRQIEGRDYDED